LDGLQQGRAYGTSLGYDVGGSCADSIVVRDTVTCDVRATVELVSPAALCSALRLIAADTLVNAAFAVDSSFIADARSSSGYTVSFLDKLKPGRAVIRTQTSAGTWVQRIYAYDPKQQAPRIQVDGVTTTMAAVHADSLACRAIIVRNPTDATAIISEIRVASGDSRVIVTPSQLDIPPGEQRQVTICRPSNGSSGTIVDDIVARVGCADQSLGIMRTFFALPTIFCQDQEWQGINPASAGVERELGIQNSSDVPLTIRGVAGDELSFDSGYFGNARGLDPLPITIPAKSIHTWYVTYRPKGELNATHEARVIFRSDALGTDSIAVLRGTSLATSVDAEDPQSLTIAPNPTSGPIRLGNVPNGTVLELIDAQGICTRLEAVGGSVDLAPMPAGVYTLRMHGSTWVRAVRVILLR
jgi:hypothetical protein